MDMPRNAFKAALKEGRRQIGLWVASNSPDNAEMLATCGYDWLLFDLEHTTSSTADAAALMRAVAPYPGSAIVRPAWNDTVDIKRLLDAGAQTLLVPYVQNAEEARAAVRAVRYPPEGVRGVAGFTRASRFGTVPDYAARASEEICLLVQVETATAVENIEEIAAVDGVDGIFVGPADLAASLGHPGAPSHPDMRKATLDAIARIVATGTPAGILTLDEGVLEAAAEAGALFVAVDVDAAILRRGAAARREAWR
ncbi:putative 2,4-dihydroxyhept-2-ene-1,7-dioic acid aldolaseoxidoreductase protein [Oceanicola granulosus HTCC2516]|uniref:Hydroxypyruvate/pyruvate aldolase n=1 Tax=Oceanicola granulosus (strain ATCC BAA-861 / DSM 15982 / KCTC 12143 / HTCC2516) TaxID=314256 RepID=Q2CEW7_OCEGH|nr:aldolase/citrate lyase family protein [Oceanicola granulosus]EAR51243.1 putative 2,4-dihydroxyhept-2-ene-1,7-dioic acid aldolaseoxidoreductase protein [Oceanicola granulosus HTCC2516]